MAHRYIGRNIYELRKIISAWIADPAIQVILTNGGTGYWHQKATAAAITPLLDVTIAGFGELFRHLSFLEIGSSTLQSDAFAGGANDTLIYLVHTRELTDGSAKMAISTVPLFGQAVNWKNGKPQ